VNKKVDRCHHNNCDAAKGLEEIQEKRADLKERRNYIAAEI